jgi:hypothetical protein
MVSWSMEQWQQHLPPRMHVNLLQHSWGQELESAQFCTIFVFVGTKNLRFQLSQYLVSIQQQMNIFFVILK